MDEQIQHDPRTKQQIVDALYEFLYAPISKEFQRRLDALVVRNSLLLGVGNKAMLYKGEFYAMSGQSISMMSAVRMSPLLKADMDSYLKDVAEINEGEMPYVMGFIRQVLNSSNSLQDYLRVLPSSVHQPVQRLALTCPCKKNALPESSISTLLAHNSQSIDLMKRRMVLNLLI